MKWDDSDELDQRYVYTHTHTHMNQWRLVRLLFCKLGYILYHPPYTVASSRKLELCMSSQSKFLSHD